MYEYAIVGGTFDILHRGHIKLLNAAYNVSNKLIIGLTTDEYLEHAGKTHPVNAYNYRKMAIQCYFTITRQPTISKNDFDVISIDDKFGLNKYYGSLLDSLMFTPQSTIIAVSEETQYEINLINKMRRSMSLDPFTVLVVPVLMAEDGMRISATRIRNNEIDVGGRTKVEENNDS